MTDLNFRPNVPVNLQNLVLAQTLSLLDGVAEYQRMRDLINRKRKKESKGNRPNKKAKLNVQVTETPNENVEMSVDVALPERPPILEHITAGINAVTKRLETQIRERKRITISATNDESHNSSSPRSPIRLVLVCRADVNPPILIDHIPHLVAAYNSAIPQSLNPVLVVPLPQNAEFALAETFGLRRVAILAFDTDTPNIASLVSLMPNLPTPSAPWLVPPPSSDQKKQVQIIPTHIKQLRTTAPGDMKLAKEQRAEGRRAAKERKKRARRG
uniref:Uncharacterized protein n=1 Tax=Moniliophthora roreri TaxID=221103 RepID=A0A0W0EV17_MONRR